ncbi:ABC transporter I family member 11, chloroplastic-like [Hibiscus syriacus]|nr:ABC transporter I family member 11, chloroplastic-like [Hibiscus syriacus]
MEVFAFSASSLFGSRISEPLALISSKPSSMLNFKRTPLIKISCGYSCLEIKDVYYRPPGTQINLLNGVSFSLPEKSFGLIFGQSGSGKTTLLQLLAGLSKPTSGSIYIQRYTDEGKPNQSPKSLVPERVGIVFQFPERYFVADNVLDEVTFGWPRQRGGPQLKEHLALNLQRAFNWVGLNGISLDKDPHSLSGGYKRRLALAIQLAQVPDLLILDEPLAGLDWKARADVVKPLKHLKKELTILVVSHDLKELEDLVDRSWRMEMGGVLREEQLVVYRRASNPILRLGHY